MIKGSIVAIVTPMHPDGALDWARLDALVDWHIDQGTHAIVAVGTTGESATLDFDEHLAVIQRVIGRSNGRVPVIAGTGSNATSEAIEQTRAAQKLGADAALLVTPYYNKPPQEGLYQHFKKIAESVDLPQILYNVPSRTGCDMQPETVARLAKIPHIVGIKEAKGELSRIKALLDLKMGDHFAIYSGDDATACESMLMGGHGDISVTANVAPHKMAQMCHAALAGDRVTALQLDAQLSRLHKNLFVQPNPIPVKWALQQMQRIESGLRLPLVALDNEYFEIVRSAMRSAGVIA
ncbi:4-hydroxy-tetrahydrodipicolinate synthase [Sinimarinibacterium sp. NLF-5-8]|uniref:4-hydroxy-tetrahydrodipicolinate synthase n=1 Tax=Sinimarinibacterium sp. NLF-5-8 TaxID=2698684 RepID=UPI00137BD005|nr:4-hydroxy-tetrahydrodipicolinate synthase [Sinimarinibacterium sp. NLF-5-8]QHS09461.1 4-hydroxy-tetrahydrodipicolinate synthase [Sinimarinibacterium sp. NLF-5-8]